MNFKMQDEEVVVFEGKANRNGLLLAHGGKLVLTNQRLVFLAHGANIGEATVSINLKEVFAWKKSFSGTLLAPIPFPNAFKIVLKNGLSYRFTVFKRKKWLTNLEKAL